MVQIGIIIQARMASTRLPNKIMLNLGGKPILWHVVERCKKANVNKVIIATSTNSENDVIEKFCAINNCPCFRGSEEDVLSRYYECAKEFNLDIILRVTSDCPLIAPEVLNEAIEKFEKENVDYLSNAAKRSYPRGLDTEIFSFIALEKAHKLATEKSQREHVTSFIYNNPKLFKISHLIAEGILRRPDLRLTIDTPEDLKLLRIIYNNLDEKEIKIEEVIKFLESHPELAKSNIESEKEHLEKSNKDLKQEFIK